MPEPVTSVRPRVVTASGEPVPNAVIELFPANPIEVGQVGVTDAKGFVSFPDAPPGPLRLVASAERFVSATLRVSIDARDDIVFTLARGYRVTASVELPAGAGLHLVGVRNESGVSMDGLLDSMSDRAIELSGRLSLGPLAPGTYVLELQGSREPRQERITIIDRDVTASFPLKN